MASGHVNRANRPNTWLHRPMLLNVRKVLAKAPSTRDPTRTLATRRRSSALSGAPKKATSPLGHTLF